MSGARSRRFFGEVAAYRVALTGGLVCAFGLAAAALTSLTYTFGPCPTFSDACGVVAVFQVGPGTGVSVAISAVGLLLMLVGLAGPRKRRPASATGC